MPEAVTKPQRLRPLFIAGALLLTFYVSCWLLGMVYAPVRLNVRLPRADFPAEARATFYVGSRQHDRSIWPAPLAETISFDWSVSGGWAWTYWHSLRDWHARVEVQGCEPLTLPISCGPWSIRAPNFAVFGAWGASYSRDCAASGELVCGAEMPTPQR